MQWLGGPQAVAIAAAGAMARAAATEPPWRVRYLTPVAVLVALAGLAALIPVLVPRSLFDLLLAPVLVVALTLGLLPALLFIALGVLACAYGFPPFGDGYLDLPVHLAALAPHVSQAVAIATVAAIVRVALRAAAAAHRGTPLRHSSVPAPVGRFGVEHLTPREIDVLRVAASGGGFDELAGRLSLSRNTVKTHLSRCYDKLGAHNRAEAIVLAVHAGVLDPDDLERAADLVEGGDIS